MSRIGNWPIDLPEGVSLEIDKDNLVTVKGPLTTLSEKIDKDLSVSVEDNVVRVSRANDMKRLKALHGLYRALIKNMVVGVKEGYKEQLELVGVGYKAVESNNVLELNLGYSHSIYFALPPEVKATAVTEKGKNPIVTLESSNKQLLGQIVAKVKGLRKIEPYKGKGIKTVGERIRRKAGKTAAK